MHRKAPVLPKVELTEAGSHLETVSSKQLQLCDDDDPQGLVKEGHAGQAEAGPEEEAHWQAAAHPSPALPTAAPEVRESDTSENGPRHHAHA